MAAIHHARRFTYDVFLSNSAKDRAVVRLLAERLRKDGVKVRFDKWEIPKHELHPSSGICYSHAMKANGSRLPDTEC